MIESIPLKGGTPTAAAVCDDCGKREVIACRYVRVTPSTSEPDSAQAHTKMAGKGWSHIKGHLRCPTCEAKRKAYKPKEEQPVENVTPIRQPTREQKREIIALLETAYDVEAGRYRGKDTDTTLAETIGGGVLFGWVAQIREDLFGPDGGNEEFETLAADIRIWRETADARADEMHKALREFNDLRQKMAATQTRLEALIKACGPKAARI